jgi:phosphoenolpyruvate carboxylase
MFLPLFESVDDLLNAHTIMEQLYTNQFTVNICLNENEANNHVRLSDGQKRWWLFNGKLSIYKARGANCIKKIWHKVIF